jgi:hypothetical protein
LSEKPNKRLPRHVRVPVEQRPEMVLTDRDCAIIKMVNDCRALRGDQIETLFFQSKSTAQYRLQRLFHHEFLNRSFLTVVSGGPASSPAIYTLGKRGATVLVERFGYDRENLRLIRSGAIAWHLLEHLLKVNDIRIAITQAAAAQGWTLEDWRDETSFRAYPDYVTLTDRQGKQLEKPVFPDGYGCLSTPRGTTRFFLEVDRGTEVLSKFAPQVAVYEAYVDSGQYQTRFQARSLRVLVVTTTERRMKGLQTTTVKAGGDGKYWFTTFERITPATILTGAIWQRLGEDVRQPLVG